MGHDTLVKVCGVTTPGDALAAADEGADLIGLVFAAGPRRVGLRAAAAIVDALHGRHGPRPRVVGVFVDAPADHVLRVRRATGLDCVQLHGAEPPAVCPLLGGGVIRALRVGDTLPCATGWEAASWLLFDTHSTRAAGGTGECFDWSLLAGAGRPARPFLLAGGLHRGNVAEAIALARPAGVDVSSGVEAAPGRKDHRKIRDFIQGVRSA